MRALRPLLLPLPPSPPATPSDPNQSKNTETKDFEKKKIQAMTKTTTSTIKAEGSDMDVKAPATGVPTPAFSKHTPAESGAVDDISKHAYQPPAKPSVEQFAQQQLAASGSAPAAAVVLAASAHPAVAAEPGFNRDSATTGGRGLLHAHGRQMAAHHQPGMTHGSQ